MRLRQFSRRSSHHRQAGDTGQGSDAGSYRMALPRVERILQYAAPTGSACPFFRIAKSFIRTYSEVLVA
jgi:hypothetical protein